MTNAERYKTAEERRKAFEDFCPQIVKCEQCKMKYACDKGDIALQAFIFLEEDVIEDDGALPCPFCGEDMNGQFSSLGPSIWSGQCSCGYKTKDFMSKEEAVAAHNRVFRAVSDSEIHGKVKTELLNIAHNGSKTTVNEIVERFYSAVDVKEGVKSE